MLFNITVRETEIYEFENIEAETKDAAIEKIRELLEKDRDMHYTDSRSDTEIYELE